MHCWNMNQHTIGKKRIRFEMLPSAKPYIAGPSFELPFDFLNKSLQPALGDRHQYTKYEAKLFVL